MATAVDLRPVASAGGPPSLPVGQRDRSHDAELLPRNSPSTMPARRPCGIIKPDSEHPHWQTEERRREKGNHKVKRTFEAIEDSGVMVLAFLLRLAEEIAHGQYDTSHGGMNAERQHVRPKRMPTRAPQPHRRAEP